MTNPNTLYANTFVDALVSAGIRRFCISPGSRNTPLTLALARHRQEIHISSHLDERSAAFFALGLAIGSGEPAGLVCTSGSAAANYFPAIIEARQSRLPMIILSADRPHELRGSGANQTIDQIKLFGGTVDFFADAPLPEAEPPALVLRHLRSLAARAAAIARANGIAHINLPFRKPLEPSADDDLAIDRRATTRFINASASAYSGLAALLNSDVLERRGIIYFGHGSCRNLAERRAMLPWAQRLSDVTGYPIFAEFTSNMREAGTLCAYETLLEAGRLDLADVEVLIRFGGPPLAKPMQDFLASAKLSQHIYCSRAGEWADDSHSLTHHFTLQPANLSSREWDGFAEPEPETLAWREKLLRADRIARRVIAEEIAQGAWFDGAALHDVARLLPAGGALFAGNSLPVRHLDQFGLARERPVLAWANRGASGIDGNVSTALGMGAARKGQPLVAALGDITLYHDMNGLLAIKRCGIPVTIVLLNNAGGGIFHRLPSRDFEPHFSDYLVAAHDLDFAHAAAFYGLEYLRADDRQTFRKAFKASMGKGRSTIIELRTDAIADLQRRAEIVAAARARLKSCDS